MAVAIICYFWLASFPEESCFLKAEDKDFYITRLERDRGNSATEPITWKVLKETLTDWTTWMTWLLFTFKNSSTYALAFFVPLILTVSITYYRLWFGIDHVQGMGHTGLKARLFSTWPYLPTIGLLWIGSYISDKTKMRIPIIIFQSILMIIGFIRKSAQYCHFYILGLIFGSHVISIHQSSPLSGSFFCNHGLPVYCPRTDFPSADECHRLRSAIYRGSRDSVGRGLQE
jgi:hypothetical protein